MSASIRLHDLTLGYEGHPAVHHLDGAFEPGSLTAVIGPNGSGKSTLLKGISGMLRPLGGRIQHIGCAPRRIAYLPQITEIDRSFPATVAELVSLGFWQGRGMFRGLGRLDESLLAEALHEVGLAGFERRSIDTLSGGQLQRALFARVLLQDAPLILLDEPFSAVDERTTTDLLAVIGRWHTEGRTVVAVLHDADLVRARFPRALLLAREPVGWGDTAAVLTPENQARARRMTEAWDEHAPWHDGDPHPHGHRHGEHHR